MIVHKPSIKKICYRKRTFGMTTRERTEIDALNKLKLHVLLTADDSDSDDSITDDIIRIIDISIADIKAVDPAINDPLVHIARRRRTIDSFTDEDIRLYFRFQNRNQMRRVKEAFRFPPVMISNCGVKFTGEEVLLCGIYRLAYPNRLGYDGWINIFGMVQSTASKACLLFYNFMWENWSYLMFKNEIFWMQYFPEFVECIRSKALSLGAVLPVNIFGFIDNTMNRTCRPGGGPAQDGENAPRNDPEIQRAFYNGWKKLHGFKWQTIDLPNGMHFNAMGPFSCRDNDLQTLDASGILIVMEELLRHFGFDAKMFGDSAYLVIHHGCLQARIENPTPQQQLINRVLGALRIIVEWDYGDAMTYFKTLDYAHILKMRKMPVAKMFVCAMILRDAYTTLNGSRASGYFGIQPPTLETWLSQGPRPFDPNWLQIDPDWDENFDDEDDNFMDY